MTALVCTLSVNSGIAHFVDRNARNKSKITHNPNNVDLLLRGILLYLMGERVSQHALEEIKNKHPDIRHKIDLFLESVEIKGIRTITNSTYDLLSYSQHNKNGVVKFENQYIDKDSILPLKHSRMKQPYEQFIDQGLFAMFSKDLDVSSYIQTFKHCISETEKEQISELILGDLKSAHIVFELHQKLTSLIKSTGYNVIEHAGNLGESPYSVIGEYSNRAFDAKNIYQNREKQEAAILSKIDKLRNKSMKDEKRAFEVERLHNQLQSLKEKVSESEQNLWEYLFRITVYLERQLNMRINKSSAISSFGLLFDSKKKSFLQSWLDSFDDLSKLPIDKQNANNGTEFYKTVIQAPRYNVSIRSPELTKRYDGIFKLFVKCKNSEVNINELMHRIRRSNRHHARIGKRGHAKLLSVDLIPDSVFQNAVCSYKAK